MYWKLSKRKNCIHTYIYDFYVVNAVAENYFERLEKKKMNDSKE